MIIYFVRHAQPDYKSGKDDYTFELSEEGFMDRYEASRVLDDVKLDAAYCSPYKRAIQTISPIVDSHGLSIVKDERLRERDHGECANSADMFRKRWEDHSFHEPGGESISDVQERYVSAIRDIVRDNPYGTVLVGTHGTAFCAFINYYNNEFGFDDFMRTINYMPWVIKVDMSEKKIRSIEEICFVEKEYHGLK